MKEKRIKKREVRPRLPDNLYEKLKAIARKEKRSMTSQVELYIEQGLAQDGYQVNGGTGATGRQT